MRRLGTCLLSLLHRKKKQNQLLGERERPFSFKAKTEEGLRPDRVKRERERDRRRKRKKTQVDQCCPKTQDHHPPLTEAAWDPSRLPAGGLAFHSGDRDRTNKRGLVVSCLVCEDRSFQVVVFGTVGTYVGTLLILCCLYVGTLLIHVLYMFLLCFGGIC